MKISKLENEVAELKKVNLQLKKESLLQKNQAKQRLTSELENFFTPKQARKIITQKRVQWNEEDIVKGLMICSLSKKTYQYIRRKNFFPLPSISTLRKWISKFDCSPGILEDVLVILKKQIQAEAANPNYKLGVLVFDEMDLKKKYEYFQKKDCIFPNHKKAQVALLRGLCHDWKQPVYYDFDKPMRSNLVEDIILKAESAGIEIWAMTCDGGTSNQALHKSLGVNTDNTSFPNPADPTRKIYIFLDVPHLLKLIRNHILDEGIWIDENCTEIGRSDFQLILEADNKEFRIHHKLTEFHLNLVGPERQRVRPAAQLLSHATASALRCLRADKVIQANFVDLINDW